MNLENLFQSWEKQLSILDGDDLLRRLPEIESVATGKIKMTQAIARTIVNNNLSEITLVTGWLYSKEKPKFCCRKI